jgi:hypothetical protein
MHELSAHLGVSSFLWLRCVHVYTRPGRRRLGSMHAIILQVPA